MYSLNFYIINVILTFFNHRLPLATQNSLTTLTHLAIYTMVVKMTLISNQGPGEPLLLHLITIAQRVTTYRTHVIATVTIKASVFRQHSLNLIKKNYTVCKKPYRTKHFLHPLKQQHQSGCTCKNNKSNITKFARHRNNRNTQQPLLPATQTRKAKAYQGPFPTILSLPSFTTMSKPRQIGSDDNNKNPSYIIPCVNNYLPKVETDPEFIKPFFFQISSMRIPECALSPSKTTFPISIYQGYQRKFLLNEISATPICTIGPIHQHPHDDISPHDITSTYLAHVNVQSLMFQVNLPWHDFPQDEMLYIKIHPDNHLLPCNILPNLEEYTNLSTSPTLLQYSPYAIINMPLTFFSPIPIIEWLNCIRRGAFSTTCKGITAAIMQKALKTSIVLYGISATGTFISRDKKRHEQLFDQVIYIAYEISNTQNRDIIQKLREHLRTHIPNAIPPSYDCLSQTTNSEPNPEDYQILQGASESSISWPTPIPIKISSSCKKISSIFHSTDITVHRFIINISEHPSYEDQLHYHDQICHSNPDIMELHFHSFNVDLTPTVTKRFLAVSIASTSTQLPRVPSLNLAHVYFPNGKHRAPPLMRGNHAQGLTTIEQAIDHYPINTSLHKVIDPFRMAYLITHYQHPESTRMQPLSSIRTSFQQTRVIPPPRPLPTTDNSAQQTIALLQQENLQMRQEMAAYMQQMATYMQQLSPPGLATPSKRSLSQMTSPGTEIAQQTSRLHFSEPNEANLSITTADQQQAIPMGKTNYAFDDAHLLTTYTVSRNRIRKHGNRRDSNLVFYLQWQQEHKKDNFYQIDNNWRYITSNNTPHRIIRTNSLKFFLIAYTNAPYCTASLRHAYQRIATLSHCNNNIGSKTKQLQHSLQNDINYKYNSNHPFPTYALALHNTPLPRHAHQSTAPPCFYNNSIYHKRTKQLQHTPIMQNTTHVPNITQNTPTLQPKLYTSYFTFHRQYSTFTSTTSQNRNNPITTQLNPLTPQNCSGRTITIVYHPSMAPLTPTDRHIHQHITLLDHADDIINDPNTCYNPSQIRLARNNIIEACRAALLMIQRMHHANTTNTPIGNLLQYNTNNNTCHTRRPSTVPTMGFWNNFQYIYSSPQQAGPTAYTSITTTLCYTQHRHCDKTSCIRATCNVTPTPNIHFCHQHANYSCRQHSCCQHHCRPKTQTRHFHSKQKHTYQTGRHFPQPRLCTRMAQPTLQMHSPAVHSYSLARTRSKHRLPRYIYWQTLLATPFLLCEQPLYSAHSYTIINKYIRILCSYLVLQFFLVKRHKHRILQLLLYTQLTAHIHHNVSSLTLIIFTLAVLTRTVLTLTKHRHFRRTHPTIAVKVTRNAQQSSNTILIYIQNIHNKTSILYIQTTTLLSELHKSIETLTGIPTHKVRTTYHNANVPVCNHTSIQQHGITAESTIKQTLRLLGGTHPQQHHHDKNKNPINSIINIATININGAFSNSNQIDTHLLWDYVLHEHIDILVVTDHRCPKERLKRLIKPNAEKHLATDVYVHSTPLIPCSLNYSQTVGGTAIFAFGKYASVAKPSLFQDPSGVSTFAGIQLDLGKASPPIFIHAVYLFPPNSPGPHTANQRIRNYITSLNSPDGNDPASWQHNHISQLHDNIITNYPNAITFLAGDLNCHTWDTPNHPVIKLLSSSMQLQLPLLNLANIITYPRAGTWIDHILHSGPAELQTHKSSYNPKTKQDTYKLDAITDHAAYKATYSIAIDTSTLKAQQHDLLIKATKKAQPIHLNLHNIREVHTFIENCNHIIQKIPTDKTTWTHQKHDAYHEQILSDLLHAARIATYKRHRQPKISWSPTTQFYYNYSKALKKCKRATINIQRQTANNHQIQHTDAMIPNITYQHERSRRILTKFYDRHSQSLNITTGQPRYIHLIQQFMPSPVPPPSGPSNTTPRHFIPNHSLYDTLLTFQNISSSAILDLISQEYKYIRHLNHSKRRKHLRTIISNATYRQNQQCLAGKLKHVIAAALNKEGHQGYIHTYTPDGRAYCSPEEEHKATLHYFEHERIPPNNWYDSTQINNNNDNGQAIREALLTGTWRDKYYHTLIDQLPQEAKEYGPALLDEFQCKATQQIQQEIHTAINRPITFEEFQTHVQRKQGNTSPGPSGITSSILKATPYPILLEIYTSINHLWEHRTVPKNWLKRIMTMIPKIPTPTLADMRPIMLLELIRKIWLSIITSRHEKILLAHKLYDPSQKGGLPMTGTEDAIMATINTIEDAHFHAKNVRIISLDKSKAFDSPGRWAGTYLAHRRLGLPEDTARFLTNCDEGNVVYPKTPYFTLHPQNAKGFTMPLGVPQGDSISCRSYNAVEDIALSFLRKHIHATDPYYFTDTMGIERIQYPVQFIDDSCLYCKSPAGVQQAINLVLTLGPILNININLKKTQEIAIEWTLPDKHGIHSLIPNPVPSRSLTLPDGSEVPHPPLRNHELLKILGAHLNANNDRTLPLHDIHQTALRISKILSTKRCSTHTLSTVINQAVIPALSYKLKFTSATHSEIHKIAAPLRQVLKQKAGLTLFKNIVTFGQGAEHYCFHYKDLSTQVNQDKESIALRIGCGEPEQQIHLQCLLQREAHQLGGHTLPSTAPIASHAARADLNHLANNKQIDTWANSLFQHLQQGQQNPYTTNPIIQPSLTPLTQTPIHETYDPALDEPLTLDQLYNLQLAFNLHYVEELFPTMPSPIDAHQDIPHDLLLHLNTLLLHFNTDYHTFLRRIFTTFAYRTITHGHILIRPGLILADPHSNTPIEIRSIRYSHPAITYIGQQWKYTPRYNSKLKQHIPCLQATTAMFQQQGEIETTTTYPQPPRLVQRFVHQDNQRTSNRDHFWCVPTQTTVHLIHPNDITQPFQDLPLIFNFPPAFLHAWNTQCHTNPQLHLQDVYTDGSLTHPHSFQLGMQNPIPDTNIFSSLIFSPDPPNTAWKDRTVHALRITGSAPSYNSNYTMELLPAAAIASITVTGNITNIITDCQSLETHHNKLAQLQHDHTDHTQALLPRNGTENGKLSKTLIIHRHNITIQHQRAHQEDHLGRMEGTHHGTGNRIADYIAQGKLDEARALVRDIQYSEISIDRFISLPPGYYPTTFGHPQSVTTLLQHNATSTTRTGIRRQVSEWLTQQRSSTRVLGYAEWTHLSWNLTGSAITKLTAKNTVFHKRTLLRLIYDKFPNIYTTEYKMKNKTTDLQNPVWIEHNPPPPCPLCSKEPDNMTHLLYYCEDAHVIDRKQLLRSKLNQAFSGCQHIHTRVLAQHIAEHIFIRTATAEDPHDSRAWAGLLPLTFLQSSQHLIAPATLEDIAPAAIQLILEQTTLAVQSIWDYYCHRVHHPDRPFRLRCPLLTATQTTTPNDRFDHTNHNPMRIRNEPPGKQSTLSKMGHIILPQGPDVLPPLSKKRRTTTYLHESTLPQTKDHQLDIVRFLLHNRNPELVRDAPQPIDPTHHTPRVVFQDPYRLPRPQRPTLIYDTSPSSETPQHLALLQAHEQLQRDEQTSKASAELHRLRTHAWKQAHNWTPPTPPSRLKTFARCHTCKNPLYINPATSSYILCTPTETPHPMFSPDQLPRQILRTLPLPPQQETSPMTKSLRSYPSTTSTKQLYNNIALPIGYSPLTPTNGDQDIYTTFSDFLYHLRQQDISPDALRQLPPIQAASPELPYHAILQHLSNLHQVRIWSFQYALTSEDLSGQLTQLWANDGSTYQAEPPNALDRHNWHKHCLLFTRTPRRSESAPSNVTLLLPTDWTTLDITSPPRPIQQAPPAHRFTPLPPFPCHNNATDQDHLDNSTTTYLMLNQSTTDPSSHNHPAPRHPSTQPRSKRKRKDTSKHPTSLVETPFLRSPITTTDVPCPTSTTPPDDHNASTPHPAFKRRTRHTPNLLPPFLEEALLALTRTTQRTPATTLLLQLPPIHLQPEQSNNCTEAINTMLRPLNLHLMNVPGDGNCFFYCIQLYLSTVLNHHISTVQLKQVLVNYLLLHPTGQQIAREHNPHLPPDETIEHILRLSPNIRQLLPAHEYWANDMTISACANLFNLTIVTIISAPDDNLPNTWGCQATYSYDPSNNHCPIAPDSLPPPAPRTVFLAHTDLSHFQLAIPTNAQSPIDHFPIHDRCHNRISGYIDKNNHATTIPSSDDISSDCQCSRSRPNTQCTNNTCINRHEGSLTDCPSQCLPNCGNHFSAFKPIPLTIRQTPMGAGAFTLLTIDVHDLILPYYGQLYTPGQHLPSQTNYLLKICNHHIDAQTYGSDARYVNHSCKPNCYLDVLTTNNTSIAILRAKERILPYSQLTFDYNWTLSPGATPTPCLCQAPCCRGTIERRQPPQAHQAQTQPAEKIEKKRANKRRPKQHPEDKENRPPPAHRITHFFLQEMTRKHAEVATADPRTLLAPQQSTAPL